MSEKESKILDDIYKLMGPIRIAECGALRNLISLMPVNHKDYGDCYMVSLDLGDKLEVFAMSLKDIRKAMVALLTGSKNLTVSRDMLITVLKGSGRHHISGECLSLSFNRADDITFEPIKTKRRLRRMP